MPNLLDDVKKIIIKKYLLPNSPERDFPKIASSCKFFNRVFIEYLSEHPHLNNKAPLKVTLDKATFQLVGISTTPEVNKIFNDEAKKLAALFKDKGHKTQKISIIHPTNTYKITDGSSLYNKPLLETYEEFITDLANRGLISKNNEADIKVEIDNQKSNWGNTLISGIKNLVSS